MSSENAPYDEESLLKSIQSKYESSNQSHVLKHLSTITDPSTRRTFLQQLDSIPVDKLSSLLSSALAEQSAIGSSENTSIEPFSGKVGQSTDTELVSKCRTVGLNAISKNEVAAVLLAGGQGTRLGFDGPKGMYDISLTSHKTLFEMIANRLKTLMKLATKECSVEDARIPLYIMTSPMNDKPTRTYWEQQSHFGLDPKDVYFFSQGTLPCLDPTGKILLETPSKCCMAPDGNGGIYPALHNSGMLSDMSSRKIKSVHVFAIDNAIVKPADPVFVGYCLEEKADCGNKSIWKKDAHEKVGVVAEKGGKACIVEYSDITKEMAEMVDETTGKLKFGAGNICNHYYTLDFLMNVVIPNFGDMYHVARKKIPVWDETTGETKKPDQNNGIKLETFIFDVFPLAKNMAVMDVSREEEFGPVKNAPGSKSDCPETARSMISELSKKWMKDAGAILTGDLDSDMCEVLPGTSYAGEGLEAWKGKTLECPFSV